MKSLAIIIPVYNEEKTIIQLLKRIDKIDLSDLGIKKEIRIINDGSTDNTLDLLLDYTLKYGISLCSYPKNCGKGMAIRIGLESTKADIILIQDGDLEYNPDNYRNLIKPILDGRANVVYGSRRLNKVNKNYSTFYLGGLFLTWLANILYGIHITDESTCYKVFRRSIISKIKLKCKRFEFCPEITAKISKLGIKIHEVPINYTPRNKSEGKKIKWIDGLIAMYTLIKYKFID